jgi:hypothetical protein
MLWAAPDATDVTLCGLMNVGISVGVLVVVLFDVPLPNLPYMLDPTE